jgi:hypothetical protein
MTMMNHMRAETVKEHCQMIIVCKFLYYHAKLFVIVLEAVLEVTSLIFM